MSKKRTILISHPDTGEKEWQALQEPLMSGWLTQGPKVEDFEKDFSKRHGVNYALATSSCTTALHLILVALGIGPGDEVIVPAFTWVSTANVVPHCGATPIFVDVDRTTFCASGNSYKGRSAGSLENAAAFSFHSRKSITTGEGDMVTTNNEELAQKVNALRNHRASISEEQHHQGLPPYTLLDFNLLGFNYWMTELQVAFGMVQHSKIDYYIEECQRWGDCYADELANIPLLHTPSVPKDYRHGWQTYVCYIEKSEFPLHGMKS